MTWGVVTAFLAAFARAAGVCATAPVIGEATTPTRVRLVLIVAIAGAVTPLWPALDLVDAPLVIALELVIGLATGTVARLAMAGVEVAGQLIGISVGLGFAAEYDPRAGESASVVRRLVSVIAALGFVAAGGLEAIVASVAAGPASSLDAARIGSTALHRAEEVLGHGVALAGPVVIAALVTNIGVALANRAAPAVNVFAVSFAAIMLTGMVVLLATAPQFVNQIWSAGSGAADTLRGALP